MDEQNQPLTFMGLVTYKTPLGPSRPLCPKSSLRRRRGISSNNSKLSSEWQWIAAAVVAFAVQPCGCTLFSMIGNLTGWSAARLGPWTSMTTCAVTASPNILKI